MFTKKSENIAVGEFTNPLINVYAIYDSKAEAYLQPWFCQNHALAFRNIQKACRNPQSPFNDFPADYTLFCIGSYCERTGKLIDRGVHENLGNFIQFQPTDEEKRAMQSFQQIPLDQSN